MFYGVTSRRFFRLLADLHLYFDDVLREVGEGSRRLCEARSEANPETHRPEAACLPQAGARDTPK